MVPTPMLAARAAKAVPSRSTFCVPAFMTPGTPCVATWAVVIVRLGYAVRRERASCVRETFGDALTRTMLVGLNRVAFGLIRPIGMNDQPSGVNERPKGPPNDWE